MEASLLGCATAPHPPKHRNNKLISVYNPLALWYA
jgi:hypothetical protein